MLCFLPEKHLIWLVLISRYPFLLCTGDTGYSSHLSHSMVFLDHQLWLAVLAHFVTCCWMLSMLVTTPKVFPFADLLQHSALAAQLSACLRVLLHAVLLCMEISHLHLRNVI